uniref:Reticulon n=1 Tax=Amphilophus citrinellus TaxID=61819 RepID=A0A3Q0RYW9_AMPCI
MATKLLDLVYWRNIWRTGVVFTGLVIGLASLFQLSALTVVSHVCLGIMCITFPLRLYYKLLELLRWNPGVHPFQSCLDYDGSLTNKETVMLVEETVLLIAFAVTEIKRLIFIESIIDSIKFVAFLYLLTYVGVQTNGLTLVITGELYSFTHLCLALTHISNVRLHMLLSSQHLQMPSPAPAPKPALAATNVPKQKVKSK